MARKPAPDRLAELLRVGQEILSSEGYARTQMDGVAKALGVGKGTVYRYVESKQALFDFVVRHTGRQGPIPVPETLPWPTPEPGSTVRFVLKRIKEQWQLRALHSALEAPRPPSDDVATELEGIIREIYGVLHEHRVGIRLLGRCSQDYPELLVVFQVAGREAVVDLLENYLSIRARSGHLSPMVDARAAAWVFLETLASWAMHRHWDPTVSDLDEDVVRATVVSLLIRAHVEPTERKV